MSSQLVQAFTGQEPASYQEACCGVLSMLPEPGINKTKISGDSEGSATFSC